MKDLLKIAAGACVTFVVYRVLERVTFKMQLRYYTKELEKTLQENGLC